MSNVTLLEVIGLIISFLFTSGAAVFFLRYGIRLALVEASLKQNSLPSLAAKLIVLEHGFGEMKDDMSEVKTSLKSLGQLDAMHMKVDMIADSVRGQGDRISSLERKQ